MVFVPICLFWCSLSYSHDFRNHRNSDLSIRSESIVKHGLSENRPLLDRKSVFGRTWQWMEPIIHHFTNIPAPLSNYANTLKLPSSKSSKKNSSVTPKFRAKRFSRDFCVWGNMQSWKRNCKKWKWKKWNLVRKKYGFQCLTIICRCHLKTAAAKWGFILINCSTHVHTSSGDSCVDDSGGANRIDVTHFFLFYFFSLTCSLCLPRFSPTSPSLPAILFVWSAPDNNFHNNASPSTHTHTHARAAP